MKLYFTRDEILMGRDKQAPLTPEMEQNLDTLIQRVSQIREAWGRALIVSSGYRPPSINQSVGGAKQSAHQSCQAVDLVDKEGYFANWLLNNLSLLEEAGLYMEDPQWTSGWVHLQIRPTSRRVFIP